MKSLARKFLERFNINENRPLELDDVIKQSEDQAQEMNLDSSKHAIQQRKDYVDIVYKCCMRNFTSNGFNKKMCYSDLRGDLSSFIANEVKVNEYCPDKWRKFVNELIMNSLENEEQKWIDSRYKFINRDGKRFVKSLW